jgi:CMP-2-keto-3-deoxyoctulosonic acid synthetase
LSFPRSDSGTVAGIQILNAQGQTMIADQIERSQDTNKKEYLVNNSSEGIYYLRVDLGTNGIITRKFIKSNR